MAINYGSTSEAKRAQRGLGRARATAQVHTMDFSHTDVGAFAPPACECHRTLRRAIEHGRFILS